MIKKQFIQLPRQLIDSPALEVLTANEWRALLRILREHQSKAGNVNAGLPVTYRNFVLAGVHPRHVISSLNVLIELRLIERTRNMGGSASGRTPNLWRPTFLPRTSGADNETNEYLEIKTVQEARAIAKAHRLHDARDRKAPSTKRNDRTPGVVAGKNYTSSNTPGVVGKHGAGVVGKPVQEWLANPPSNSPNRGARSGRHLIDINLNQEISPPPARPARPKPTAEQLQRKLEAKQAKRAAKALAKAVERTKGYTEHAWQWRLEMFSRHARLWDDKAGPPPGAAGCLVPPHMLLRTVPPSLAKEELTAPKTVEGAA